MLKSGMPDESCKVQAPPARSRRVDGAVACSERSRGAMNANRRFGGLAMVEMNDLKLK